MAAQFPAPRRAWPRVLAMIAVVVVMIALAAAVFVLSYSGLHVMALNSGVAPRLARYYPGILDAALVIACLAALMLRDGRWWARSYAWLAIIVMVAVGAGANAIHAMNVDLPHKQTAGVVAAAPWVLLLLAFSLWLTILRQSRARRSDAPPSAPVPAPIPAPAAVPAPALPVAAPVAVEPVTVAPDTTPFAVVPASSAPARLEPPTRLEPPPEAPNPVEPTAEPDEPPVDGAPVDMPPVDEAPVDEAAAPEASSEEATSEEAEPQPEPEPESEPEPEPAPAAEHPPVTAPARRIDYWDTDVDDLTDSSAAREENADTDDGDGEDENEDEDEGAHQAEEMDSRIESTTKVHHTLSEKATQAPQLPFFSAPGLRRTRSATIPAEEEDETDE